MSLFKVDKIQPRSKEFLEIEKAKLQNGSIIDLNGGTNLGTAAGKDEPYFVKSPVVGTSEGKLLKLTADGQAEASDIDPVEVTLAISRVGTLQDEVNVLASGGPKGVYADSAALILADPDHANIYLVHADNKWYYHNGTTFVPGALYQDSAAFNELAGVGRGLETVVGNAVSIATHQDSPTPHKITDGVTTWMYGLSIVNLRGFKHLQFNIEEVV